MTLEEQIAARDADMRCMNCRWWDAAPGYREADSAARCRKLPPSNIDAGGAAIFPGTEGSEWCGEFTPHLRCHGQFGPTAYPLRCFRPVGHPGEHG